MWPKIFEIAADEITNHLQGHVLAVHHVGSTAVVGMDAKDDIDILCIVDDLTASLKLQEIGYIFKGELNIPLRYYFSKNTVKYKVNLHVCMTGHNFIKLQLCFRDYLRNHKNDRLSYTQLKHEIVKSPNAHIKSSHSHFVGYTYAKNVLIKNILKKAGFDEYIMNLCAHDEEWQSYDNIIEMCKGKIIKHAQKHNKYRHLILYKGIKIIAAAYITGFDNKNFNYKIYIPSKMTDSSDIYRSFEKNIQDYISLTDR